jgi:hypothetical protein
MARKIEDLESKLAIATRKSSGQPEMEELTAPAHEADSNLAQATRWLMQGGHILGEDDVLADKQTPTQVMSADSFATAEEGHSSAETVISNVRLLGKEDGKRRMKRRKY